MSWQQQTTSLRWVHTPSPTPLKAFASCDTSIALFFHKIVSLDSPLQELADGTHAEYALLSAIDDSGDVFLIDLEKEGGVEFDFMPGR